MRFKKHYTREQARQLLPEVRRWLDRLAELRPKLTDMEGRLTGMMAPGCDLGGSDVNSWVAILADIQAVLIEFYQRDLQVKDVERGLIDFPAIRGGREVFLCWEKGEEDVEFWHDVDSGYAGREPL